MSRVVLCRLADLAATGAKGVTLTSSCGTRRLVVVCDGAHVRAYDNNCPHLGMPLEILPDHFLDETRENLVCRTHGARFAVADGYCISGPCRGAWLRTVPVSVRDGEILLEAT